MRKNAQVVTLVVKAGYYAFEGALAGALLGTVVSLLIVGTLWCINAGIFWGMPASKDLHFGLLVGLTEGAIAGALISLFDSAVRYYKRQNLN